MITTNQKNKKSLLHWILEEPFASTIPSIHIIDKTLSFFTRIFYITIRIFLGVILGKKRRESLKFYHKIRFCANMGLSFYFFLFFYKIIRTLRIGNPSLIKLELHNYRYKIYCPATEEDYILMTEREEDLLEHFCPNKNDTVIDIGSYLGKYTFICSNRVGKEGKVIAIEANPIVYEKLNKNIELNQSTNITTLNCAVFSEKRQINLFLRENSSDTIYSPHNTVMLARDKLTYNRSIKENCININANTLDNIISSLRIQVNDVKWIKIDVEGAELEVLKGSHNILSKSKDITMLIEIHHLENDKNLFESIMNLLNNYNFKIKFQKIYDNGERHIIVRKQ